ncbi:hypothetical protein NXW91_19145 [Bacteroides fragilis]|nr:hypothetical protein [Bacteroides fragilis]
MKELNFDWLLNGSCLLSDVAMAYFTTCVYPRSAGKRMRDEIERYPEPVRRTAGSGIQASQHTVDAAPDLYRDPSLGNARHGVQVAARAPRGSGSKTVRRPQIRLIYFIYLLFIIYLCAGLHVGGL